MNSFGATDFDSISRRAADLGRTGGGRAEPGQALITAGRDRVSRALTRRGVRGPGGVMSVARRMGRRRRMSPTNQ